MRRKIRRRIFWFSVAVASLASLIAGGLVVSISVFEEQRDLAALNERTLARVHCSREQTSKDDARVCDISELQNAPAFDSSDYLIDLVTSEFLFSSSRYHGFELNRINPDSLQQFSEPRSVQATSGATWRLYAEQFVSGHKPYDVIVGYVENANWLVEPTPG